MAPTTSPLGAVAVLGLSVLATVGHASGETTTTLATGTFFRDPFKLTAKASGPEMVAVTRQTFWMGSRPTDPGFRTFEIRHRVTVDAFAIGRYEVTNKEFCAFLNARGNQLDDGIRWILTDRTNTCLITENQGHFSPIPGADDRPVVTISWNAARAYCAWLTEQTGRLYRLPTEAEWECAARAGTETTWSWGDTFDPARLQCRDSAAAGQTVDVGSFAANRWGISDMEGNVWEWVLDCFEDDFYTHSPSANPLQLDEDCWTPEIRGGSFNDGRDYCRPGYRINTWWWGEYPGVGFRVCRVEKDGRAGKARLGTRKPKPLEAPK